MRIFFMGGHELGKLVLEHLINLGKDIIGVAVTNTTNLWYKGVDEVAEKYEIPLYIEKNINDPIFVSKVRALAPDLILVVNFEQILKSEIIAIPYKGCINTHASLLPKYRGRAPLNWAIIRGEKETGVTVHYINENIDDGDIILQRQIEIDFYDYISDVMEKVKEIYPIVVEEALDRIEKDEVIAIKQNSKEGFYCKRRNPQDGQINWDNECNDIYNLIRAVSHPYPGAYTYYNDSKYYIWRAEIFADTAFDKEPGTIIKAEDESIFVKARNGVLKIIDYKLDEGSLDNNSLLVGKKFIHKDE